jgi:Zn-dependent protease with chaperone function
MSFIEMLCLVLAAVYASTCVLLSIGVALIWHAALERRRHGSAELLTLRLAPPAGAAFLTLTVALPAFLIHEPHHDAEPVGPLLGLLAVFALYSVGSGILRGFRAWAATRALLRRCRPAARGPAERGPVSAEFDVLDDREPLAAVVGAWRPRILAADCVREALSDEEFLQVIAHETAHVAARDNVKLLLQIISPDALTWMPAGTALTQRWRAAAELEADARAVGLDHAKRLALASALLKVARLSTATEHGSLALRMSAADDVAARVRQLLAPLPMPSGRLPMRTLVACLLLIAVIGVPLYGSVHECIESLVTFGSLSE